ncbi:hypothetical protein FGO68_gene9179 [Halteria grandinella]|uniref:ubiquitinyl hydrolase 1 n=1 Tax=Halteria grandinella TaxID=5974 RepID=A0A8J8P447_HALGN|nr:hypothetical protein FGO68_gene9179 [Halteria grandinella]
MKKKAMKDFAEIFELGGNFFQTRGQQISRQDFLEDTSNLNLDFTKYESCKHTVTALLALKPDNQLHEREAILSVLNHNNHIEDYIEQHLDVEDTFYIVIKKFFDAWAQHVGFSSTSALMDPKTQSFQIKKQEKLSIIDNNTLIEILHTVRLQDVQYGVDYIIVPRFVYFALSKWYPCNQAIERKVIQYRQDKNQALSMFKSKKVSNTQQMKGIPDSFFKIVDDCTYELEVYPKFIYFEKINDKGERPHQRAIINQKIDPQYIKKSMKSSEKLPFFELSVSRKTTFEEVLRIMSAKLQENSKRGRLWIEDQVINGVKLAETLEEFGISAGQVIYAEYATNSNQWPTDSLVQLRQGTLGGVGEEGKEALKSNGLYNLGNTCYMNSALQCLANTKFFYEFFSKEKRYQKQMNLKSKHGHQGELAENFASLMQDIWQQGKVVYPRQFKKCISNISEQFQGYDQQDSQEFLSFLLDGLHEELNLRLEKPYIENPDYSPERNVTDLALETWSNSLRRDWSFIFFMFFGQLKSTLNCQTCNKVSITFDNFTSIPLSLPEPSKILVNIVVYRLPSEIKSLLSGKLPIVNVTPLGFQGGLQRLDSFRSDEGGPTPQTPLGGANIKYTENDELNTLMNQQLNNQPIKVSLRVDKDIKIYQILQQLCEIKEVNIDLQSNQTAVSLYAIQKGQIRGIFNQELRLNSYQVSSNEIEAIEHLTRKGRDAIKELYRKSPDYLHSNTGVFYPSLLANSEKPSGDEPVSQKSQLTATSTTNQSKKSQREKKNKDPNFGLKLDRYALFNNYYNALERYSEFEQNQNFPDDVYVLAYHRRFVRKQHAFFCALQPQIISSPLILLLPIKPSGRRIYDEVWAVASNILKKSSIYHDRRNRWWEQAGWEEKLANAANHKDDIFKPFILKTVDRSGYTCSQCTWMKMCSGCLLSPSEEHLDDFFKKLHLAIEWHSSLIEEDYNEQVNDVIQHQSTQDKQIQQEEGAIQLEDCLKKFQEVEEIGQADHIYCADCKKPQGHLKRLEIFRPPPILIIQLKRFKFAGTLRNKLSTMVEFPLFNLDLSSFVSDQPHLLETLNLDLHYDLYGLINHFGSLHYGHYTSLIRNLSENKWYQYDDSHRTQILEEQIQKEAAYILFYIRKDVQSKSSLDEIFPHITRDMFPGKPVTTENGHGFILEKSGLTDQGLFKVQYEKGRLTEVVSIDQIKDEKDQDEIHYDAKQLQEIESHKKDKQKELSNRPRKCELKGRCKGFFQNMRVPGFTPAYYKPQRNGSAQRTIRRGSIKAGIAGRQQSDCNIF